MKIKNVNECEKRVDSALIKSLDEMFFKANLELKSNFQGGNGWTEKEEIAFIEHLLNGNSSGKMIFINNPKFQLDKSSNCTRFMCADGLKRFTAIKRFVNNEFKVLDSYYKDFDGGLKMRYDIKLEGEHVALNCYIEKA